MRKKHRILLFSFLVLVAIVVGVVALRPSDVVMLNPKGWVAFKQRDLMILATVLMSIVVLPVFFMTVLIAWKYRANNKKANYQPEWDYNFWAEAAWWGIPFIIVTVLSIFAYKSSHELDPYRPLVSEKEPLTIQVVALEWKWLFIYPKEKIATVNFVEFPAERPIHFELTSDAPMNSFWIPQLGGQIYAMSGMKSQLHLIADEPGVYRGSSANLSGLGFSGMTFEAKAVSPNDFDQWVKTVKKSSRGLTRQAYQELAKPSQYDPVATYRLQDESLFDWIIMKYMMPGG